MSPFIARLVTRLMLTATCVLLLFAALMIEIKDDTPRVVCANATIAECDAVQDDSYN